ncbi:MAG: ATP-binding protein [Anaerolineales bacterium]
MDSSNSSEYEISLWGPSSSGKTTLMNSLMRALYQRSQRDPVFDYLLLDADEENLQDYSRLFSSPLEEGTTTPRTTRWVFQRRLKSNNVVPSKVVNIHSHLIQVHDMNGVNTINLDDPLTRSIFENSKFILLMLDHTLLMEGETSALTPWGTPGSSRQEYLEKIEKLIRFLETSQTKYGRKLAVCFTKIDLLSLYREPWDLIKANFGVDMANLLQSCSNKPGWSVESFAVSALGFVNKNGKRIANFNKSDHSLIDVDGWVPHNVESPFFWMFNEIEQNRLKQYDFSFTRFSCLVVIENKIGLNTSINACSSLLGGN